MDLRNRDNNFSKSESKQSLKDKIKGLEAESQSKTEFIVNFIHDIRSPLSGIVGLACHLVEEIGSPQEKHCAKVIHQGSKQLLELVNTFLDSDEKSLTEDKRVVSKVFNLRELIEKLRELEEPLVFDHRLKLEVEIDSKIPNYFLGDKLKIERILLNLVSNAIKFTKEGEILVKVRLLSTNKEIAHIEFIIQDTGVGIAEEEHAKVFQRYFKTNAAKKANYKGNGLGLHIVQNYVRLLGGELDLQSNIGKGTAFSFVLPMTVQKTPKAATTINKAKHSKINKNGHFFTAKPRLLIVEDNETVLMSMMLLMQKMGIEPQTAINFEQALQAIHTGIFDLIITDIELPDGSGQNLSMKIRALEKAQNEKPKKIIGLTGHTLKEVQNLCMEAGMDEVFQKPLDLNLLASIVDKGRKEKTK